MVRCQTMPNNRHYVKNNSRNTPVLTKKIITFARYIRAGPTININNQSVSGDTGRQRCATIGLDTNYPYRLIHNFTISKT